MLTCPFGFGVIPGGSVGVGANAGVEVAAGMGDGEEVDDAEGVSVGNGVGDILDGAMVGVGVFSDEVGNTVHAVASALITRRRARKKLFKSFRPIRTSVKCRVVNIPSLPRMNSQSQNHDEH